MNYRQSFRKSRMAEWGFKLAVISAHIIVFTVVLHRYASQSTAVSLNLLQIGFVGALVAFIVSIVAAFQIWNKLLSGFGKSILGAVIALLVLVWPIMMLPVYFATPKIYDVSTDIKSPPEFDALKKFRAFGSNPTRFRYLVPFDAEVRPLRIMVPGQDAFDFVRQLVIKRKWELVASKPPGEDGDVSYIEAVDRSFVLAMADDIVIRIRSRGTQSVLDIRSAARYGSYDLGRNQKRIIEFLDDFISQSDKVSRIGEFEPLFLDPRNRNRVKRQPNNQPIEKPTDTDSEQPAKPQ